MSKPKSANKQHIYIVNVGLFRSGATTLVEAAKRLGMKACREFPNLTQDQQRKFLHNPDELVLDRFTKDGLSEVIRLAVKYDIICDGWIALLPLLQPAELRLLQLEAGSSGVHLEFVASTRDIELSVKSELHHWIVHDLERKAGLSASERQRLEDSLHDRALQHQHGVHHLHSSGILQLLPLAGINDSWSNTLSRISDFVE